ncbi:MAG: NUDIX hydrolase, partial [Bradyrhizobium sp.]|nr:NUDIX hydrolase [Bradyrhizobium sp.]
MTGAVIHRVTALDLKVEPWDWPFARERRDDIAAHFAERQ